MRCVDENACKWGPRAKVGMIMGPRATNMQASKNILLTKKRTLTHVCVWCEREKKSGEIGEKQHVCVVNERETHKKTCQNGLRMNEEAIERVTERRKTIREMTYRESDRLTSDKRYL